MKLATQRARSAWTLRLIAVALTTLPGCGNDNLGPPRPRVVYSAPPLFAVTLPESVAVGDSVDVVVHMAAGGCYRPDSIWIEPAGLRRLRVHLRASEVINVPCPADIRIDEARKRFLLAEAGTWTIEVVGADAMWAEIVVGDLPLGPVEHRFTLQPRERPLAISSEVVLSWWRPYSSPPETLRVDVQGRGAVRLPCAGGESLRRLFSVQGWSSWYMFEESPDDCVRSRRSWFYR